MRRLTELMTLMQSSKGVARNRGADFEAIV